MFAIEIDFQDNTSAQETAYVRRPLALIGGLEGSNVFIEDMKTLDYQLAVVRDVGRSFRCKRVFNDASRDPDHETVYENTTSINLGPVILTIVALDSDISIRETEPPDRAGVRVLRHASSTTAPKFPAVLVLGNPQIVVSFDKGQPLYIGRSKQCALRLEAPDVSAQHARIGYDSGEFWIEDLGSTNGTFVNQQQVSGRVSIPSAVPVVFGRDSSIMGISTDQQLRGVERSALGVVRVRSQVERKYPVLISISEVARPARLIIPSTGSVQIGRDPTSDMWIGAPHISRMHCSLALNEDGTVTVTDQSTNGTSYDNSILHRGDSARFSDNSSVFDFGGGVTVGLCFNDSQEQSFISSQGSHTAFIKSSPQTATSEVLAPSRGTGRFISGMPQGGGDGPVEETVRNNFFQTLGGFYRMAGTQGKLVIILVACALLFIFAVSITLLRPLFG